MPWQAAAAGLEPSVLGFEFVGMGERGVKRCIRGCRRRPDTGRDERLSPWIAPYENFPVIESVRICCAIGDEVPHPVLIWRSRDMVYYFVGNSFSGVKAAARRMQR